MKKRITIILTAAILAVLLIPLTSFTAQADKTVRVGWVLRKNVSEVNGEVYSGYNYDYLMEIAKYTDWEYEFVTGDITAMLKQLEAGEIDMLGTLLYADERAQKFSYAEYPYGEKYTTLYTREDSILQPYGFEAFNGMSIGILSSDSGGADNLDNFALNSGFTYSAVSFDSLETLNAAVNAGTVDGGIIDADVTAPGFLVLAEFAPVPFYFAVTKGKNDILYSLNRALCRINAEQPNLKYELYDKFFNVNVSAELTESERKLADATKTSPVKIGVVPSSEPMCYRDSKTGEYTGICMEILSCITSKTGLEFSYSLANLAKSNEAIAVDESSPTLVMGILKADSFDETRDITLSDALIEDALVIVGRRGNDFTQTPQKKTIAVMSGFKLAHDYIKTNYPQHSVLECATLNDCMDAVAGGNADATIYIQSCVNYLLQNPHYDSLEIVPSLRVNVEICIASLSDGNAQLMNIINKGLNLLTPENRQSIVLEYTLLNPYELTTSDMLYKNKGALAVIAVLVLIVFAILIVLAEVKHRGTKKLEDALLTAEKASAAKGSFMSRMSHEIRTPLNAVIGYNTIAQNELSHPGTEEQHRQAEMKVMDCLTKSDIASKHLLTIINDVLDMAAIESGKIMISKDKFDFRSLISSLTAIFYSQAKSKGVELEVIFDTMTEEWFIGDQMRVNQILTNLLSNAVKFTPEGGTVKLTICQPEAEKNAAHIHFEVSDTGIGMTKEYVKHIWTPFEQADSSISRRFGGTGLGLSITKNLVDLMGGTIEIESQPGSGTVFRVDLTFERTEQPQKSDAYDFSKINALIVDDDIGTCDYIKLLFSYCGVRCTSVLSGKEAVNEFTAAKNSSNPFTVCLVDWRMPKMDGIETISRIRTLAGNNIPVIVITAYDFSEIADKAAEIGVNMFIAKPLFRSSLFDLLVNISGSKPPQKTSNYNANRFSGQRVLLVEDNTMNMEIARRILESSGLKVDCAWNGKEAAEIFTGAPAGMYKSILMDVQMPIMDGFQSTKAIRTSSHPEAKTIPIIAMTADAFAENVAEALNAGMNDHISKPINLNTLFETLEKHMNINKK